MEIYPLEIVSDAKGNVIRVLLSNGEAWKLNGKCLRCGECCHSNRGGCESFEHEILNGVEVAKCNARTQWAKPWQCKIYPTNPYDPKEQFETCGYSWEKI